MKRRWTGFAASLVILVSSCLPAVLNADAAAGGTETAVLTMAAALFIIIRITDVQTGSRGIRRTNRR